VSSVSRAAGAPLYDQIIKSFEANIQSGDWAVGDKLPSERELCELYSVSRITVRRAVAEAEREGLVERVHGVGNFVASPKMRQSLQEVKGFGVSLAEGGMDARTQILSERVESGSFAVAGVLGTSVSSPVHYLQLLGLGGDVPLVIYDSYLPGDLGPEVLSEARNLARRGDAFSTLDIHRARLSEPVTRIEQTYEAVVTDEPTAALLGVGTGFPVFRVESVMRSEQRVLEYRVARYRGDKYKFAIERTATEHPTPLHFKDL
jgi:GntR family transcriptional regulator